MDKLLPADVDLIRGMLSRSILWWRECFSCSRVDPAMFVGVPGEPEVQAAHVIAEIARLEGVLSRLPDRV